jgi:hypothetical protein
VFLLFGRTTTSVNGYNMYGPPYTLANHPDGTSNQIAVVERYMSFPTYGWSNAWAWPEWDWWGVPNAYGSFYGHPNYSVYSYGPQIGVRPKQAHPYYANSGHAALQALLLDGHVKGFSSAVSLTTWGRACTPDDGAPLGSDFPA